MTLRGMYVAGLVGALAVAGVYAQENPNRVSAAPTANPATVTVVIKGADAKPYVSVKASNSDVRQTLNDIAAKAKIRVLVSPMANGVITGTLTNQSAEEAVMAVAKMANLTVRKVAVPESAVSTLTADDVGMYSGVLNLPVGAVMADPATGKSIAISSTTPAVAEGQVVVYCVQGQFGAGFGGFNRTGRTTPGTGNQPGERAGQQNQPRAGARDGQTGPGGFGMPAPQLSPAGQALVDTTAASLSKLPASDRMSALRAIQMQIFQNMTDEERSQMGGRMPGARGGFRRDGGNQGPDGPAPAE